MTQQSTLTLNTGAVVPQLGFGVFKVPNAETEAAVTAAFEAGYRSVDTAAMYGNEAGVGAAIERSGLARDELFITTKLNNDSHGTRATHEAFDRSLKNLGLDYIDLYLIHWPMPRQDRYVETWRALEEIHRDGRARAIGVSNFHAKHLRRLFDETGIVPAVNQIELHPFLVQEELRTFDAEHGIVTEAWSPLARGGELLSNPVATTIAEKYGKTPAQIVIAWHLHLGNMVIPKSATPARIVENIDVFDIDLDGDDAAAITGLNRNQRVGPDPDNLG